MAIRCWQGCCELQPVRGRGQSACSRIPKSSPTSGPDELLRRLLREGNAATPRVPSSFEWCTDGALHQPRWPLKELIPRLYVGVHKLMHVCVPPACNWPICAPCPLLIVRSPLPHHHFLLRPTFEFLPDLCQCCHLIIVHYISDGKIFVTATHR